MSECGLIQKTSKLVGLDILHFQGSAVLIAVFCVLSIISGLSNFITVLKYEYKSAYKINEPKITWATLKGTSINTLVSEKTKQHKYYTANEEIYAMLCTIWYHLHNLQNVEKKKKKKKKTWRSVAKSRVFSRFLNCTDGTKLRNAPHIFLVHPEAKHDGMIKNYIRQVTHTDNECYFNSKKLDIRTYFRIQGKRPKFSKRAYYFGNAYWPDSPKLIRFYSISDIRFK